MAVKLLRMPYDLASVVSYTLDLDMNHLAILQVTAPLLSLTLIRTALRMVTIELRLQWMKMLMQATGS